MELLALARRKTLAYFAASFLKQKKKDFCSQFYKIFIFSIDAAVNNKHYTTRDIAGIGKEKHPSLFCRGFGRNDEEKCFVALMPDV